MKRVREVEAVQALQQNYAADLHDYSEAIWCLLETASTWDGDKESLVQRLIDLGVPFADFATRVIEESSNMIDDITQPDDLPRGRKAQIRAMQSDGGNVNQ
jgi:hypothetical protein